MLEIVDTRSPLCRPRRPINVMVDREAQFDPRRAHRAFDRAAERYDASAILQAEVRNRLLERLDLVKLAPSVVLDLGCGTGQGAGSLARRYPKARVLALDAAPSMARAARRGAPLFSRIRALAGDAHRLPLADTSIDLIFSNLALHWCEAPDRVFLEFQRVLRPNGLVMFTSLGPDTLRELRIAWRAVDGYTHVHQFEDMHNLGDALIAARLAEPVMDMEHLTLTYGDAMELMRDLKSIGAANAATGRARGLTGKGGLRAVTASYEQFRDKDGRLPATFEVVYGHAWGPVGPVSFPGGGVGVARVPLSQLRRR